MNQLKLCGQYDSKEWKVKDKGLWFWRQGESSEEIQVGTIEEITRWTENSLRQV